MESAPGTLSTRIRWVVITKIARVDKRSEIVHVSGWGNDAVMKSNSLGWYVQFEGSQEAIFFGDEKPEIEVGDEFRITFERMKNAISS